MEISFSVDRNHPYFGRSAVLTTKHKKYPLIAPAFSNTLELKILEHAADTDQLGTFSGEIERKLPPRETAILKAKIGMKDLGLTLGLASEGSVGPDPLIPFIKSDIEYLVLIDSENDLEITEVYRSFEITAGQIVTTPEEDISEFLRKVDFPNHKLITTPNAGAISNVIKGIGNSRDLKNAIKLCANESDGGSVLIQSDLRAHCSPSRQNNIREVAALLANRVLALCPQCHMPGWGNVGHERGLECSLCGMNVAKAAKREIFGCYKCEYREHGVQIAESADPAQCDWCNP